MKSYRRNEVQPSVNSLALSDIMLTVETCSAVGTVQTTRAILLLRRKAYWLVILQEPWFTEGSSRLNFQADAIQAGALSRLCIPTALSQNGPQFLHKKSVQSAPRLHTCNSY